MSDTREGAPAMAKPHIAFLSSLSGELTHLREQLHSDGRGDLWVAEIQRPELKNEHPLKIVDVLIGELQQSELFICVLAGRRRGANEGGTPIEVGGTACLV